MPEMMFKVSCTEESAARVKGMLRNKGLRIRYKDKLVADYYAIADDMSCLKADRLGIELEKDLDIFDVEVYPTVEELKKYGSGYDTGHKDSRCKSAMHALGKSVKAACKMHGRGRACQR